MSVERIKADALQLSQEARAYLVRELLASLEEMSEDEIEKLWLDEAIRRDEELDKEKAQAYPVDKVLSRARARRK